LYVELCRDQWASLAYDAVPAWLATIAAVVPDPESLLDFVSLGAERPDLSVLPLELPVEDPAHQTRLREYFEHCAKLWQEDGVTIRDHLDYKGGKGCLKAAYKPAKIQQPLADLDLLLSGPVPAQPIVLPEFGLFTSDHLKNETRVKCAPPSHPFFEAWQSYVELARSMLRIALIRLQHKVFVSAGASLAQSKESHNIRAYSDMLVRLADALKGPAGAVLAGEIFKAYPAALIDEFQDTDPIQFSIFRRIYEQGRGSLFLIGDPKQAIYAFRGGDIYAYLRAVQETPPTTLNVNYRSDRPLVEALGRIYTRHPRPFIDHRIPFVPVKPNWGRRLRGPSDAPAPVQIKMIRKKDKGKAKITGTWAESGTNDLAALVANDIVRFLKSDAELLRSAGDGEEWTAPRPSDVAVLVRRNKEAVHMQNALLARGVHGVIAQSRSVFSSPEANELWAVLEAILHPASERLLRAAVTTHVIGLNACSLCRLIVDDVSWAAWAARFRDWRVTWERHGFAVLFRSLLIERLDDTLAPAQQRLVALPHGARTMTNLLHLGELLQQEAIRGSLGPVGLMEWFAQHRSDRRGSLEDEELRLESDSNAVTIMTVHRAKGLQFPVVWCPYGHFSGKGETTRPLFHGDPPKEKATISLDPDEWENNVARAAVEQAAEEQRVLYVSLTRALHRNTLFWGEWNQKDDCALGALLHPPPGVDGNTTPDAQIKASKEHVARLDEDARMADLENFADSAPGLVEVDWVAEAGPEEYHPATDDPEPLSIGTFHGRIRSSWRRTSYTGLTASMSHAGYDNPADRDELVGDDTPPPPEADEPSRRVPQDDLPCSFLEFPAGRKPGILLHAIFEHIDFQHSGPELERIVTERLARAQLNAASLALSTAAAVSDVLATPLGGGLEGFTLAQLSAGCRLDEMPFTFAVSRRGHDAPCMHQSELAGLLRQHGRPQLAARLELLKFGRLRGHLTGLIDLVFEQAGRFWIVDYKSNLIGEMIGDYHPEALAAQVARHHYDLQYLIYAVALHRYLELRVPDYSFARHFGGVRYLFVRGMNPTSGAERGVFIDTLSEDLITELSAVLRDPTGVSS